MPFTRPTLSALVDRTRGDFKTRLGIQGAIIRRTMANVLATVWAGAVHMLHGHLEWLAKQLFADLADEIFLIRHAALYGLTKIPATFSSGTATATGTDPNPIPQGSFLVRDDGERYVVLADAVLSGGTATISIEAVNAGAAGDLDASETLTFESPLTGVDSDVTIDSGGLTGGNDQETTEELRARLLLRLREPPEGGADQDYEAWSLAVAGVTRVWVRGNDSGPGTVTVYFVRDNDSGSIFPSAPEVADVQAAVDAERPITADVTVAAPSDDPIAFTISISPDTAANRAAVEAELDDLFFRDAAPGDGVSLGTIYLSKINVAVGVAADLDDFSVTVPAADVVPASGDLPTRGTVTWV